MPDRRAFLARTAGALALLLVLPTSARAQAPAPHDSMEVRVDAVFARYDNPGCAVAVLRGDEVVLTKAYGVAHLGFGVPMTTATSLWIPYSEARVFTALAVAMLARDGQVALDEAVRRYVPEVPAYAEAVTVRQLIHHTVTLGYWRDASTLLWGDSRQRFREAALNLGFEGYDGVSVRL